MKPSTLLIVLCAAGVALAVLYPFLSTDPAKAHRLEVEAVRNNRDAFMRTSDESPFKGLAQPYEGLNYYSINPAFRVQADLETIKERQTLVLGTSDGQSRTFLTYGWAEFDLMNQRHRLLVLEHWDKGPDRGNLFLAFTDETSASESYGGGRYLDVRKVPGATTLLLDFNLAYNPYCAYNNSFSCPFPPKENHIAVAVSAGEKNYH